MLGSSPGLWVATAASYCPSRAGELPKQNMTKSHERWDGKLYFRSEVQLDHPVQRHGARRRQEVQPRTVGPRRSGGLRQHAEGRVRQCEHIDIL